MNLGTLLIILLIFMCLGGLPQNPYYQHGYGYAPSGLLGVVLLIFVVLLLLGRI